MLQRLIILSMIIFLFATDCLASKARILSLGTPMHILDHQLIALNPIFLHQPNAFIFESGLTTATNSRNNAEAIITASVNPTAKFGFAFGKVDELHQTGRAFMNSIVGANTYQTPQNPIHAFFGQKVDSLIYSIGTSYSNYKDKLNSLTDSSFGLVASARKNSFLTFGSYSLVNAVEAAGANKFDGSGTFRWAGRYFEQTNLWGVDISQYVAKSSNLGLEQQSYLIQNLLLRVVNSKKVEQDEVFFGAGIQNSKVICRVRGGSDCSTSFNRLSLPVIVGFETAAADWLIIRGSITQTVALNQIKDEIFLTNTSGVAGTNGAVTDFSSGPNNTTLAGGIGFHFGKVKVDGLLTAMGTQTFDMTTNFMSQVGITYLY